MYLSREHLRLVSDPVRGKVLELLGMKEMSTSGVAAAMGDDAPGNLYYHVHRLLEAGLIRLVRTEPRRGTVEKFYRAAAKFFAVKPEIVVAMGSDPATQDDVMAATRSVVEGALHEFSTSVARGLFSAATDRVPPVVAGIRIRGSEARLRELGERIERWVTEVSGEGDDGGAKVEYAGLVMFFPTELPPRSEASSTHAPDES